MWVNENIWRLIIVVLIFAFLSIISIVTIKWLEPHHIFIILSAIYTISLFFIKLSLSKKTLILLTLTVIMLIIYLLIIGKMSREIKIKIKKGIVPEDYFCIAPGSNWDWVKDEGSPFEKVLSVTNSYLTGHFKKGIEWCDYYFAFKAKIKSSNFSFAIRVADRNHCIFFQCGGKGIYPHLVMEGITVRRFNDPNDPNLPYRDIELPFELPRDKWLDVSVLVKGKRVELEIDGIRKEYNIPSFRKYVYTERITPVMDYTDVEESDKEIRPKINDMEMKQGQKFLLEKNKAESNLTTDQEKDIEEKIQGIDKQINEIRDKLKGRVTQLAYDFERGTVGFREDGNEHSLFKYIIVKLLDKI